MGEIINGDLPRELVVEEDIEDRAPEFIEQNSPEEDFHIEIDPNQQQAWELLTEKPHLSTTLEEMYTKRTEDTKVEKLRFRVKSNSTNVLYASELLIGNQDSAIKLYTETIDALKDGPEKYKPDVVVLSGFMQGYFKHLQKPRRAALLPELSSMDKQYRYARQMIDKARELGVPVVYNMGDDDHRILEEHNLEYFRRLDRMAQDHSRKVARASSHYQELGMTPDEISTIIQNTTVMPDSNESLNYKKVNDLKGHEQWIPQLKFQREVCFPYRLHAGRRLRTAEEMIDEFGPEANIDEYFLLRELHQRKLDGKRPLKRHRDYLDMDAFRGGDFFVTDDVDITYKTNGGEYTDAIRHYLMFNPNPMYQTHMKVPLEILNSRRANGQDVPDGIVTQNNQEEVGVLAGERLVHSTGGLIDPTTFFDRKASSTNVTGDISRRLNTTRRRAHSPSMSQHERFDDGRQVITIHNDHLREKSFSLPERVSIPLYCDWQAGSISMRPELQILFMDYVRTRILGETAVHLMVAGDMVHGRNYANFPSESQSTGLMSMDAQKSFVRDMIRRDLENYTPEQVKGLLGVDVQPGNHEWNSGTLKWHGDSFTMFLRDAFEGLYMRNGATVDETKEKVKLHDQIITPDKEVFHTYSTIRYLGAIGIHSSHFPLDKGAGGGLPIYQAHAHSVGAGRLKESIDIDVFGHFHNGSYGVFGNKLAVLSPSLAGVTGFEWRRGLRASIGTVVLEIGAGQPPQVVFMPENAILKHKIKEGPFSDKALRDEGYTTDHDFDPQRHSAMMPSNYPKSAMQKKIRDMVRAASERHDTTAELR